MLAKIILIIILTKVITQYKAAVVQASSVFFDKKATIEKALHLCREAAKEGAKLLVFPESFIPAYPRGLSFGAVVGSRSEEGRALWQKYFEVSVNLQKDELKPIRQVAKQLGLHISIGITEQDHATSGTLYCSNVLINDAGEIIGLHRKLKPTGSERIIWGEGDGKSLKVYNTKLGKIGALICWENYMPLARMALYEQGVQVYLAPTADARPTWQSTLQHIACEGRCFVLSCNQYVARDEYPTSLVSEIEETPEALCAGGSAMYDPMGLALAGPVYNEAKILYAEVDLNTCIKGKMDFDVAGHYQRKDVFQFSYPKDKL